MLKRPAPKQLSAAAQAAIIEASAQQTGKAQVIRSYDDNFPVFEVPINKKVLIYVPNHTVMTPDGAVALRMDKFAAHPVIDGRSYADIRCTSGIIADELGLDGSCPLCSAMNEVWDLYKEEYAAIGKSKGIDINSAEAQEGLKNDRIELIRKMVVKQAEVWYTFPIVVIDCDEGTVTPKKDASGKINGTPMWYSIRERTYLEKWGAGFDSLDDDVPPTSPAGLWAILNFTYTPKSGNHDRKGSAKSLKVTFKPMAGYEQWATYFDQITEEWTPEKAQEVVVLDVVRDMNEMNQATDTLMKNVRTNLAMYSLGNKKESVQPPMTNADNALAAFGGGTQVQQGVGAPPVQGAVPAPQTAGAPPVGNLTAEMPDTGVATA